MRLEKKRAADRKWRAANREKVRAAFRKWRAANPGKHRAAARAWYVNNREKARVMNRKRRAANPEKVRAAWWARKYGMTPEEFDSLRVVQQNCCAICGKEANLCVDHDHATGKVRGLLCGQCNAALGLLKEDPAIIQALLDYAKRSKI